ncbi:hypothetical protein JOC94_001673 [Bacillus thermophilus]|uniref:Transcriptional regulator n=1 Tax=Siminovitchia thermophila TaxID=1245522 RepID=A0ABS2R4X7_9BACI|nr:hypothetical protein [Siminovitchia thermophila]MBM7714701.1 hypothetical protein [Siminovitchia thermophila]
MKNRIGIVGPQDSVDLILEVAQEFHDRITQVPFVYTHSEEAKDIVLDHKDKIDVWFFSGQAPYAIAEPYIKSKSGFYPSLTGFSLTKVLLDISYRDQKSLDRLSFDTIPASEVMETFSELHLQTKSLELFPYSGYKPSEELFQYHYDLYKQNKVDCCITGIHSVYKKLNELGVPSYRLIPTKMDIRDKMLIATQRSEIMQFQSSQISILILQIHEMSHLISKSNVSFDAHRLSLKLQEIVIEFAEKIQGSFIQQGIEKFIIFSTRGTLEDQSNQSIFDLLEKIKLITNLPANLGIGYGITVVDAEQNAYLALNHANQYDKNTIMLVDEKGVVNGPLFDKNSISFTRRIHDSEVVDKLQLAGVNVSTYTKVLAVQEKLRNGSLSAHELAKWLGMTQRNARRILSDLEKHGLAQIVGEEVPGTRGRPRRIFKVGKVEDTP